MGGAIVVSHIDAVDGSHEPQGLARGDSSRRSDSGSRRKRVFDGDDAFDSFSPPKPSRSPKAKDMNPQKKEKLAQTLEAMVAIDKNLLLSMIESFNSYDFSSGHTVFREGSLNIKFRQCFYLNRTIYVYR